MVCSIIQNKVSSINVSQKYKPTKKSDKALNLLISGRINSNDYVFVKHATQRLKVREISDLDVINILLRTKGYNTRRNKKKDVYEDGQQDWKYCVEGTRSC